MPALKRIVSLIAVAVICTFTSWGTTSSATEQGMKFVFTSFGQIQSVVLENVNTKAVIELGPDDVYDYETFDFVDKNSKEIHITKIYIDGEKIEQYFDIGDATEMVGIYDDGSQGESWLEIDGEFIF